MQLFSTKPNPSQKFIRLSHLRTQRESKANELAKIDAEIASLEAELNQFLGNAPAPQPSNAHHTQTVPTTQVMASVPKQTQQPNQQMAQANIQTRPNTNAVTSVGSNPNAVHSRLAPSVGQRAPMGHASTPSQSAAASPQYTAIPGMAAIVNDRAPYHTERLQIIGVIPTGQIVMHKHYLAGDGITSGIPATEGCNVEVRQSGAGKMYRLMEVPALKITCTLSQPLPESIVDRKRVINEWLSANNWLTSQDTSKAVFHTEYDAYGSIYSPYVSVDSKGTSLFIYIGCESMSSAKPYPSLIA